jgi:hypothetical protein
VRIGVAGSAAIPSLVWEADTNTGFCNDVADNIAISTGGAARARFDANVTADEAALLLSIAGGAPVRVSKGAVDSGGAGFAVLRVPN